MNIFRFIADMLHLSAILILLYRIRKNRNCIGTHFTYLLKPPIRSFKQNTRALSTRLLHQVPRLVHVLHISVQHPNESVLYLCHWIQYLPHESEEALLHCNLSN